MISYVDAHDNETLFDALTFKLPIRHTMADRVRMNTLVAGHHRALAQTPSFWHAGTDLLRSKSLDRNCYNSGDWFNTLDWTGADNGFGHGLPPQRTTRPSGRTSSRCWPTPTLKPSADDVGRGRGPAQDLLRLRFSTRRCSGSVRRRRSTRSSPSRCPAHRPRTTG